MTQTQLICVVDDDESVRGSLRALLESGGLAVLDFVSARQFLAATALERCECLVVDIRMPEMNGLELQEELIRRGHGFPVVVITGHGDVPLAVRAMKAGALDFIEKPFDADTMLASVRRALETGRTRRDEEAEARAAKDLLALLTPRERHVLEQLVAGRSNKVAAYELGISPRTIEIHRARIMEKMKVRSLSEVVRIALTATRLA
ncbi:MAG: response regulator transcription factor [Rhizomicrobium sp.]